MSDKEEYSRIEAMMKDHERRIKLLEQELANKEEVQSPATSPVVAAPPPKPTVRQLVLEKAPADDVQRCVVIGYHLEKREDYKSFNAKDIEKGFVDAREKVGLRYVPATDESGGSTSGEHPRQQPLRLADARWREDLGQHREAEREHCALDWFRRRSRRPLRRRFL